MYRTFSRNLIVALSLSGAVFAQSQSGDSLGDAARANRAQQQVQEASGSMPKVITNQDLPPGSTPAPQPSTSDTMTMVSGVNWPNRYPDRQLSNRLLAEQRTGTQWKMRIEQQEDRIANLQDRIDRMNASIHATGGTAQYETPANRYQAAQMERLSIMQETLNLQKRKLEMMQDAARRSGMNE
jgi:hypothetical protein